MRSKEDGGIVAERTMRFKDLLLTVSRLAEGLKDVPGISFLWLQW